MKLGILLPAYNEEKNIKYVINDARNVFPRARIVVVDDGSKDKTYEIAKNEGVTVLRHAINKGKGEALKTGFNFFLKSGADAVIVVDADRQYPVSHGKKILKELKSADFVSGFRIPSDVPFANRLGNFIWRKCFNILFGTKLRDVSCGFVGLNKRALRAVRNIYGGYIIESSMFVNSIISGLKISQVPVRVSYRGRKITKFVRMFFGVLFFIINNGLKYRLGCFERLKKIN